MVLFVCFLIVCVGVFAVPDVVAVIILYALWLTAWAEMAWLFGMMESMVWPKNNSQSVE